MADQVGAQILSNPAHNPWNVALMKLTLGQIELAQVLPMAKNSKQRCEAHCYAAERLLTLGQVQAAVAHFDVCIATQTDCFEFILAAIERELIKRGGSV